MQIRYFISFLILLNQFEVSEFKVLFMVPKNGMQEQQLNSETENLFQFESQLKSGWLVEANVKNTFYVYLRADNYVNHTRNASLPHVFYIFFTINDTSCQDYINYTHIPIILNKSRAKLSNLFQIEVDVTLKHELDKVYYVCLSKLNENHIFG